MKPSDVIKPCVECRHFDASTHKCRHDRSRIVDYVTGMTSVLYAHTMRMPEVGYCQPEGKLFEPIEFHT